MSFPIVLLEEPDFGVPGVATSTWRYVGLRQFAYGMNLDYQILIVHGSLPDVIAL